MRFFPGAAVKKSEGLRLFEDEGAISTGDHRLPYVPISQPNNSFLREINHTFSFSDVVCLLCLCLVPIFGVGGLLLGFAIPIYFSEYIKNDLSEEQMAVAALLPPLLGLFACMAVAFCIWSKTLDWSIGWERGAVQSHGEGMAAACQKFFSLANPCLARSHQREPALMESSYVFDETEDLEHGASPG